MARLPARRCRFIAAIRAASCVIAFAAHHREGLLHGLAKRLPVIAKCPLMGKVVIVQNA